MIVLFTDFGLHDPYVGQVHGALAKLAPRQPVIDLLHNLRKFDVQSAAYLLPTYLGEFPQGTVFLCVVDPGVGGTRLPVMLNADERWFVGPDNGLFSIMARRAVSVSCYEIIWRPETISSSFHGRDLFAPVAAMLANRSNVDSRRSVLQHAASELWPEDLAQVVYVDHFGNAMIGTRATWLSHDSCVLVHGQSVGYARTFSEVPCGSGLWYENANGLVEVAINQGSAASDMGIQIGDKVEFVAT